MKEFPHSKLLGGSIVKGVIVYLVAVSAGCSRAPAPPAPPAARPAAADANTRSVTAVSVATLRAGQHVVAVGGSDGRAVVGQTGGQTGGGRTPLAVVAADGVRSVLPDLLQTADDVPAVLPAGVEVSAIAPLPRGGVLLYVADQGNRDRFGGLWRWRPGGAAERVAETRAVAEQSGLGSLLTLADAQAVTVGGDVWLALRSLDQTALLRIDAGRFAGGDLRMSRPFATIRGDSPAFRLSADDRWFARADGGLCLLRPATGETWRLDATGMLVALPPIESRPVSPVPPLDLPANGAAAAGAGAGRVMRFYPDPPPRGSDQVDADAAVRYPAFVITDAAGVDTVYDRDAIHVRAGFPTHGLRLAAWCVDPTGGDVLAYDAMSGEVLRFAFGG